MKLLTAAAGTLVSVGLLMATVTLTLRPRGAADDLEGLLWRSDHNPISNSGSGNGSDNMYGKGKFCQALLSTPAKEEALLAYRAGDLPLLFWHPQKAGGSTFCQMAVEEMRDRGIKTLDRRRPDQRPDCHFNGAFKAVIGGRAMMKRSELTLPALQVVDMEPAYTFWNDFPTSYHAYIEPVLRPVDRDEQAHAVWSFVPHAIAVREPLGRASSAFFFNFLQGGTGFDGSIHQRCVDHGLNITQCVHNMFAVLEGASFPRMWPRLYEVKIRTQVLGNFLTMHLSTNEDLGDAKANLRRFALIVDATSPEQHIKTSHLVSCTLGWRHERDAAVQNVHAHPQLHDILPASQTARLRALLQMDSALYAYAAELVEIQAASAASLLPVVSARPSRSMPLSLRG